MVALVSLKRSFDGRSVNSYVTSVKLSSNQSGLIKDAIDRSSSDPNRFRNISGPLAGAEFGDHILTLRPRCRCSTPIFPFCLCLGNALSLAFQHDFSLELSNAPDEVEQKSAGRGVRVEVHRQNAEGRLLLFQSADDPDEVGDGPGEAIKFRDDEGVAFSNEFEGLL